MKNKERNTKGGISALFANHKKEIFVIMTAVLGAALLIIGDLDLDERKNKNAGVQEYTDITFYTEYLEDKIELICKSIGGIEEAEVFLTLDCSREYVYGDSVSDYLILKKDGGEEAEVLYEIYPKVRGIAVVCTGGDLPRVRETVSELLEAAVGIPISKIKVAGS